MTINGGSSSIKFALFETGNPLKRNFSGAIDRIGLPDAALRVKGFGQMANFSKPIAAQDHTAAVDALMDWIEQAIGQAALAAVGHRVVHGGPKYSDPQSITPQMIEDLRQLTPFDPEHLPEEIQLTEAFHHRFPDLPQVACFDTAFHHDLPRVALLLPIPRRCGQGRAAVRVPRALLRVPDGRTGPPGRGESRAGPDHPRAPRQRRRLAAVQQGKPVDTSMSFTPTAGVPMSTRSGDLDPGLLWYLARTEKMAAKQFNEMVNFQSGLLGVSETSSDMRAFARSSPKPPMCLY